MDLCLKCICIDAPIEHCSPLLGIYDAMHREHRVKTSPPRQYKPEECLSWEEALYIYTQGGAYACRMEDVMGKIEPGCVGDMVLLYSDNDNSSMRINPQVLQKYVYNSGDCNPELLVMVNGTIVTTVDNTRVHVSGVYPGSECAVNGNTPYPPSPPPPNTTYSGMDGKNSHWDMLRHTQSTMGEVYCMGVGSGNRSWEECRCCTLREFLR